MHPALLHVVSVYANPLRWDSRLRLARAFEERMVAAGVRLTMVECQLGARPWELDHPRVNYVRVRNHSLVWNKENLLNLGVAAISRLDPEWQYLMWADADIEFLHPDWAAETVHLLQQYPILQPWDVCYDLGPGGAAHHMQLHRSFCYAFVHGLLKQNKDYDTAHPGYAWAIRRRNFQEVGGLIETAALGAGDRHMSFGLIGCVLKQIAPGITDGYKRPLLAWQSHALRSINQHLGYMTGAIRHYFHGRKPDRQYWDRWQILVRWKFDPATDLRKNEYGVIELAGNKPGLTHDIEQYFRTRAEDGNLI